MASVTKRYRIDGVDEYTIEYRDQPNGTIKIVAVVPRVVIPARLKFRERVRADAPAMLRKVADEGLRASEVAMTKALKKTIGV